MNDIITLMWIGDIIRNMNFFLGVVTVLTIGAAIISIAITGGISVEGDTSDWDWWKATQARLIPVWVLLALLCSIGLLLPSKDTVRVAIALKAGQQISQTQIGQKATDAANAILDRIINEAKPK